MVGNPTVFARFADSQAAHGHRLLMPRVSADFGYEELAVVIDRPGRYIPPADAMSHVAGYSCHNDNSLRNFQWHTHQFTPGKNFPQLGTRSRLNGEIVQEARLGDMIFDVPTLIAYRSSSPRFGQAT